jgi:hypothetical protein
MIDLWRHLPYSPHDGQAAIHDSDARFKVAVAGARFGKSLCGAREMARDLVCGDARGWLVAPIYALAKPEFSYLARDIASLDLLDDYKSGGRTGHSRLTTQCGGETLGLSAHSPYSLLGEELDWLVLCEAAHLERDAWERYLRPRLGTRLGRMVASSTPRGTNWWHELYVRAGDDGDWARFHNPTWDNPGIAPQEIDSARKHLPADVFDEQYGGQFTSLAGRVYPEFKLSTHVAKLQAPPGARIVRGVDFGFTNPMAVVWLAEDGDGGLLALREYFKAGATVEQAAEDIRRIDDELRGNGLNAHRAFADPSGKGQIETLRNAGIAAEGAFNDVKAGIDAVRAALRPRGDGRPGLLIDPACPNLIREIEAYRWQEGATGSERAPEKVDDHALDALRYAVMGLRRGVRVQVVRRL